ncbi:MAG TPA: TolC family protein [Bacteroidetes bacterium]|nr:TolC family protein [Bacteroidota bacterium]
MKLVNTHKLFWLIAMFLVFNQSNAQVWTLKQCIDTALVHNKNLQINRNNSALGNERHQETKANLIPKITANADYKYFTDLPYQLMPLTAFNPAAPEGEFREAQFGVPHSINANLQLTMPIYNPQVYGAIKTTQMAVELNELQLQRSEEQVFFEVSNLYYNAQVLHHQGRFIDSNLVNANRLLTTIRLLHEQLLATGNDVNRIALQVTQLTAQKENIASKYQQVLNGLKFMMGVPLTQHLEIDTAIFYKERADYARSTNLDLRILKTQNGLLQSERNTLNRSRFLPSAGLFATYGTTGFGYDKQPNTFLKFYPIGFTGIQLSYPLFNGTVTQRKINQKTLEIRNNELQYTLLTEQISMQIENATLQITVSGSTVETSKKQIELAQSVYAQTVLQQKQGIASLTDVLLADNALREAQQNYLNAVVDYLKADLELKKLNNQLRTTN